LVPMIFPRQRDEIRRRPTRSRTAPWLGRLVPLRAHRAGLRPRRGRGVREPALRRGAEQRRAPRRRSGRRPRFEPVRLDADPLPLRVKGLGDPPPLRLLLLLSKLEFQSPLHPEAILTRQVCLRFVTTLTNVRGVASDR